jgi:L-ascorbate metabolism protein UlaG (beta-lactamase superfamily)
MPAHRRLIKIKGLGQSGFRFEFGKTIVYVDPYLSDSVQETHGEDFKRQVPIPIRPEELCDADWTLITHIHLDHCDPQTLLPISKSSRRCSFLCPNEVAHVLRKLGIIHADRIIVAKERWVKLGESLRVMPVPAAHTEIEQDPEGYLKYLGYVIEYAGRKIYHAGDTSPSIPLFHRLNTLRPIEVAFLPVNERNFYREQRGIIGNMSVREAFRMASDLRVSTLVPIHWDMFELNSVYPEEIQLLYEQCKPPFDLLINPDQI